MIVTPALAPAVAEYEAAGFRVMPGGRHDEIPTENALIAFEDGSYLELLAPRDAEALESLRLRAARPGWDADLRSGQALGRRFYPRLTRAPGVADFVLAVRGLDRFAAEARKRGFPMTGPTPMSRARKDGVRLEWMLALPEFDGFPFFIEDRTPREQRVPSGDAAQHGNGARGIAEIRVRVASVPQAALAWGELFDAAPRALPDGRARFEVPGAGVVLEPGEPEGACAVTVRGLVAVTPALAAQGLRSQPAA